MRRDGKVSGIGHLDEVRLQLLHVHSQTTEIGSFADRHREGLSRTKQLVSGGLAGCVAKTAVAPLSRVTILMQVQSMRPHKFTNARTPNNSSLAASAMKIYKEEGFFAFWRGNIGTIVHRFPYAAVTFFATPEIKGRLEQCQDSCPVPVGMHTFVAAALGASLACTIAYPLDVVKTRLTSQTKTKYYKGVVDALAKISRDEGCRGLYRGLPITVGSVVPMVGLTFAFYDHFFAMYSGVEDPFLHALCAGGSAGALSATALFPVDLVRRQMQMNGLGGRPAVYGGVGDAVRHIYAIGMQTGRGRIFALREFYRGLLAEVVKVTPNNAIMFATHSKLLQSKWPFES